MRQTNEFCFEWRILFVSWEPSPTPQHIRRLDSSWDQRSLAIASLTFNDNDFESIPAITIRLPPHLTDCIQTEDPLLSPNFPTISGPVFRSHIRDQRLVDRIIESMTVSGVTQRCCDLLKKMTIKDPLSRPTIDDIRQHPWYRSFQAQHHESILCPNWDYCKNSKISALLSIFHFNCNF